jgi:hypothetical protein
MKNKIPTIDLKLESKVVKGESRLTNKILVETPYMMFSEYGGGSRKIWSKNKWKIFLYYLWRISGIRWIAKQYNKISR